MRVRFHPAARQELLDSELWYYERSRLAAAAFVQEIGFAVKLALTNFHSPLLHRLPRFAVRILPALGFPLVKQLLTLRQGDLALNLSILQINFGGNER